MFIRFCGGSWGLGEFGTEGAKSSAVLALCSALPRVSVQYLSS
jgi:hypothetical protein